MRAFGHGEIQMDENGVSYVSVQKNARGQMEYQEFLNRKSQDGTMDGFEPLWMPDFLFDFQKILVEWAIKKGKSAIFADCGLGKTPMQLVWAENVLRKMNKSVLILTPLAVSYQTIIEGEKFSIETKRSTKINKPSIYVTNYERLHHFDSKDFSGVVCDESSILKSFDGVTRGAITEFMKKIPYRLLCTATAAPNDYIELGTSSEALGELGYIDMLNRFFKNQSNNSALNRMRFAQKQWMFKPHAEKPFWRWVCSWARSIRKPSDIGFDDNGFILPALIENENVVKARRLKEGMLFSLPACGLQEEREERRRTIEERCEKAADLVKNNSISVSWCHLNDEGDILEKMIPGSIQISGKDSDDSKEEKFIAFSKKEIKSLITKPVIGAWGLNWQHCSHMTMFASHSFEQYYQSIRRCWRFGQSNPVTVDNVFSEGEKPVLENIKRKADQTDKIFTNLVLYMQREMKIQSLNIFGKKERIPSWL